jgi:TolA-binding protein
MSSPFTPPEADLEIAPPSALELLWTNHRGTVIGGVAALIAVALLILGITVSRRAGEIASQNALAAATDAAGWNAVISGYPGTPAAADAMLLLAASLRDAGKLDESDSVYSRFAETFTRSPIAVSALIGRASNARVSGKAADALNDYQQAAAAFPQSYGAPFAILSQARLLAQDGKSEAAGRLLQALATQYSQSVAAQAAGIRPQVPGAGSANN